jgi:branched-chain amino acid transport system ATP-binding protein
VRPLNELTVLENVMVGACFGRENRSLREAREIALAVLEQWAWRTNGMWRRQS